jgi:hypothetical protein
MGAPPKRKSSPMHFLLHGKDKKLSRAVQGAIGEALRDHYCVFVASLPLHLVGLAHRVGPLRTDSKRSEMPSPFDQLHSQNLEVFDPPTLRILVEAFDKAWRDLDSLKTNPATQKSLALLLLDLVKEGERNSSQLASKAVLRLIASGGKS